MSLLGWALVFLLVSLVAALFGFTNIASGAAGMARILFSLFLVIFLLLLVVSVLRGSGPPIVVP
ncbi:MAG: DUF1328 family protein [Phycisphaerae bacterium]|nr:DUF1328 family protein [Phycisphaerae bacterium]